MRVIESECKAISDVTCNGRQKRQKVRKVQNSGLKGLMCKDWCSAAGFCWLGLPACCTVPLGWVPRVGIGPATDGTKGLDIIMLAERTQCSQCRQSVQNCSVTLGHAHSMQVKRSPPLSQKQQ